MAAVVRLEIAHPRRAGRPKTCAAAYSWYVGFRFTARFEEEIRGGDAGRRGSGHSVQLTQCRSLAGVHLERVIRRESLGAADPVADAAHGLTSGDHSAPPTSAPSTPAVPNSGGADLQRC
ncbi:MAG: hypothetical protein ACK5F7_23530, partial [Planctomycetaceae bacterium]